MDSKKEVTNMPAKRNGAFVTDELSRAQELKEDTKENCSKILKNLKVSEQGFRHVIDKLIDHLQSNKHKKTCRTRRYTWLYC